AQVHEASWWQEATPAQIAGAYKAALDYKEALPDARAALEAIGYQVHERYGYDLHNLPAGDVADHISGRTENTPRPDNGPSAQQQEQERPGPSIDAAVLEAVQDPSWWDGAAHAEKA